jgi:hypothetical protein
MKNLVFIIVSTITASFLSTLIAQPSYIYEGGNGGGYDVGEDTIPTLYQFLGGNGVGYSLGSELTTSQYLFYGGINDGYSSKQFLLDNSPLYRGGVSDGFIKVGTNDQQTVKLFEGGLNGGYVLSQKYEDFIWTGILGTGWLIVDNWNYNIVPDLKRKVIIPAGVPNFPSLNAGIFAIGDNPNGGIYLCADLWIQDSAFLETKVNNFVENYGTIKIDGTMNVKNPSSTAMQNKGEGIIRISSIGNLIIKP